MYTFFVVGINTKTSSTHVHMNGMLPCLSERRRVAPSSPSQPVDQEEEVDSEDYNNYSTNNSMEELNPSQEELGGLRKASMVSMATNEVTTDPNDYDIYQPIGVGCAGTATILIAQFKPAQLFTVVRYIDLEALSMEQLEEVEHEMKISQLLHHSNIVCYLTSFVVGTHLCAIQPLMHYGSCADIMHSAQPFRNGFKESVIAVILRDVVQGLEYLHNLGYVHRSVRAKHFLITESGKVKLSGLRSVACMITEGSRMKSLHGHFASTVDNICWLAPEVLAQDLSGYSFKSDTYSIGIAALELATGEAPFAGLPVTEIMMLKLRGHPPILMRRQDGEEPVSLSATFTKVVDQCFNPDPKYRPTLTKLLSMSFLKSRKKSTGVVSLNELLRPVVPLDTSKLTPSDEYSLSSNSNTLESDLEQLTVQDPWAL